MYLGRASSLRVRQESKWEGKKRGCYLPQGKESDVLSVEGSEQGNNQNAGKKGMTSGPQGKKFSQKLPARSRVKRCREKG